MPQLVASAALLALVLGADPALADRPDPVVEGPYCSRSGCSAAPRSSLGTGAGFAAAALAALSLGRRRG